MARLAAAGAYFFSRLHQQTTSFASSAGCLQPLDLLGFLKTVEGHLVEQKIGLGAKELVRSRLIAVRVPEAMVNERRRRAKKHAKKKGDTPSQAHRTL